jgi:hypothetical protein
MTRNEKANLVNLAIKNFDEAVELDGNWAIAGLEGDDNLVIAIWHAGSSLDSEADEYVRFDIQTPYSLFDLCTGHGPNKPQNWGELELELVRQKLTSIVSIKPIGSIGTAEDFRSGRGCVLVRITFSEEDPVVILTTNAEPYIGLEDDLKYEDWYIEAIEEGL